MLVDELSSCGFESHCCHFNPQNLFCFFSKTVNCKISRLFLTNTWYCLSDFKMQSKRTCSQSFNTSWWSTVLQYRPFVKTLEIWSNDSFNVHVAWLYSKSLQWPITPIEISVLISCVIENNLLLYFLLCSKVP